MMCLQDIQLQRACFVREYDFNFSGAGTSKALEYDNSRVGLLIVGPNVSTVSLRWGDSSGTSFLGNIVPGSNINVRFYDIRNMGAYIFEPLWIQHAATLDCRIVEYTLPLDTANLKRLAETGKW